MFKFFQTLLEFLETSKIISAIFSVIKKTSFIIHKQEKIIGADGSIISEKHTKSIFAFSEYATGDRKKTNQEHAEAPDSNIKDDHINIEYLLDTAKKGNVESQSTLGVLYASGEEVEENKHEAVQWFRKAAKQGHAPAQYNLGLSYALGAGIKENHNEAVQWYRKAAEQGLAEAQLNIGAAYAHGKGVKKNHNEAVQWFRKAAKQGLAGAQVNLGLSYIHGEGVEENKSEAVQWFRKAAEQGYSEAQFNLAVYYRHHSEDSEENKSEAVQWYRKAAEQGHAKAQLALGLPHTTGEGVQGCRKVAEQGHAKAQLASIIKILKKIQAAILRSSLFIYSILLVAVLLGYTLWNPQKPIEIKHTNELYRKAIFGDAEAQFHLGYAYYLGNGIEQNDNEAACWYYRAAKQGHAKAQFHLGNAYKYGDGVTQNARKAENLYRKAAAQGHIEASAKIEIPILEDVIIKWNKLFGNNTRSLPQEPAVASSDSSDSSNPCDER